ncbi:hypothetical protein ACWGCW_24465 [Streptomyces sp. NPDC054933]
MSIRNLRDARGDRQIHLLCCYHPSQRNTFTGWLTLAMLRDVLRRAAGIAGLPVPAGGRPTSS